MQCSLATPLPDTEHLSWGYLFIHFDIWFLVTGQNIRKLVKDGFVIKKPEVIHSRARARVAHEAKVKGRHTGPGAPQMITISHFDYAIWSWALGGVAKQQSWGCSSTIASSQDRGFTAKFSD